MSARVLLRRAGPGDAAALAALEERSSLHAWSEAQVAAEVARSAPDAVLVLELLLQRNPKNPAALEMLRQLRGGG